MRVLVFIVKRLLGGAWAELAGSFDQAEFDAHCDTIMESYL